MASSGSQSAPTTSIGRASAASATFINSTSTSFALPQSAAGAAAAAASSASSVGQTTRSSPATPRRRHRSKPNWDSRIHYPSITNNDRHATFRRYFTPDRPDANGQKPPKLHELPKDPKLREMVVHRRDFYINARDPHFYNPAVERGWDARAGVVGGQHQHQLHAYHRYYDGGLYSADAHTRGVGQVDPAWSLAVLPNISHHSGRFDFLRKHSRTPQSPLLLNQEAISSPSYDADEPRYQYFTALTPLSTSFAENGASSQQQSYEQQDMASAALTGDTSVDTSGDRRLPLPLRDAQRRVYSLPVRSSDDTNGVPSSSSSSARGFTPAPPTPSSSMMAPSAYHNTNNGSFTPRVPVPPSPVSMSSSSPSGSMSARRAVRSPRVAGASPSSQSTGAFPVSPRRQPWDDRHHVEQ